jgi:hypothetical protein
MTLRRARRERRERALVHLQTAARLLDDRRPFSYIAVLDQLTHYRLPLAFEALVTMACAACPAEGSPGAVELPAFWNELDGAARALDLYTSPQPAALRAAADICRSHAANGGGGRGDGRPDTESDL